MDNTKKMSISEVAAMLGVAPSTVSRALSGKKGVSEAQREKIIKFASELGYQPNSRTLNIEDSAKDNSEKDSSRVIGMILGDIRNPFYSELVYHIQHYLNEQGYLVVVFNSEYDVQKEILSLESCEAHSVAGLILVTAHSSELEKKLADVKTPVVLVNRILPGYNGDSVIVDNFQAGYMAAMHLIDLNHTRIGFICGPRASSASSQRFEGFKQALRNLGLPLNDSFIFESELKIESGRKAAREFLNLTEERPGAVIAANDLTAIGFMDVLKKSGLSVPGDVSIVSFDNTAYASVEGIMLTSIDHHVEEMGKEVARLLFKQLGGDRSHPERVILSPELVIRNSTARCEP